MEIIIFENNPHLLSYDVNYASKPGIRKIVFVRYYGPHYKTDRSETLVEYRY